MKPPKTKTIKLRCPACGKKHAEHPKFGPYCDLNCLQIAARQIGPTTPPTKLRVTVSFLKRLFGGGKTQGSPDRILVSRETSQSNAPAALSAPQPKALASADDLFKAAENGDAATIRALLGGGADVNARKGDGETVLILASSNRSRGEPAESVHALLDNGAEVNARDNRGLTALIHAAYFDSNSTVIQALLDRGADVNAGDNEGRTALTVASGYGNLELARILVANGADVNAVRKDGATALIEASSQGHGEFAKYLLANGANPNVRYIEQFGMTPLLIWASMYYHPVVGKHHRDECLALLDKGADVNARDNLGRDALMLASKSGNNDLVQALRANGATGAAQADAEAARLKADAKAAQAAEANAKRLREERVEAQRLEAEAVARGELLPRPPEAVSAGEPGKGTFRAAGLTWQQQPAPQALNCDQARSYAANLALAGVGWRLPTVQELHALYKATRSPTILGALPGMDSGWYWSISPHPEGNTWCFNFSKGSTAGNVNDEPIAVRCVVRDSDTMEASRVAKQVDGPLRNGAAAAAAVGQPIGTFRVGGLTWQRAPAP